MNPHARMSISLVLSLVLWYPSLRACLAGDVDILAGSLRWALGFGLAWFAVGAIGALVRAYTPEPSEDDELTEEEEAEAAEAAALARRREDFAFEDELD